MKDFSLLKNILVFSIIGSISGSLIRFSGPPFSIWSFSLILFFLIILINYLLKDKKYLSAFCTIFFYAFFNKLISILDFRFIIINKTTYTSTLESYYLLCLCVFEEIILPMTITGFAIFILSKKRNSFKPIYVSILSLALIDLLAFKDVALWWSLWFYNPTTTSPIWQFVPPYVIALIPYACILLIFSKFKFIKVCGWLILVLPFIIQIHPAESQKNMLKYVTVIARPRPYQSPDTRPILSNDLISLIRSQKFHNEIFLWNEVYFVQNNKEFNDLLFDELRKSFSGIHFLGIYNMSQTGKNATKKNEFLSYNAKNGLISKYQKNILNPFDESNSFYHLINSRIYLDQNDVQPGKTFKTFDLYGKKVGIFLCNEIAHLGKVADFSKKEKLDMILSPSNVPLFYKNSFEETLIFYSRWVSAITAKPILRYSSVNSVQVFEMGRLRQFPTNESGIYEIGLNL